MDLHGQHEHQTLLRAAEQREILDAFAGGAPEARAVAQKHAECASLRDELERLRARERELKRRSDSLAFQLEEIEGARIEAEEDERVERELRRLEHAEELARDAAEAHGILYGGDGAVSEVLAHVQELLGRIARVDPGAGAMLEELGELYHRAVDLGERAGRYATGVEISPARGRGASAAIRSPLSVEGEIWPGALWRPRDARPDRGRDRGTRRHGVRGGSARETHRGGGGYRSAHRRRSSPESARRPRVASSRPSRACFPKWGFQLRASKCVSSPSRRLAGVAASGSVSSRR